MLHQQIMQAAIYTLIVVLGTLVSVFGIIAIIDGDPMGAIATGAPIWSVAHFTKEL